MNGATGFHIDVRPVSITFTCPHCGREVRVPWQELDVPECWGDDWGYALANRARRGINKKYRVVIKKGGQVDYPVLGKDDPLYQKEG